MSMKQARKRMDRSDVVPLLLAFGGAPAQDVSSLFVDLWRSLRAAFGV
jgi:hypothetical protein